MQKARRHPITRAPTACRRTVSGTISLAFSAFFSPFPHGTGSLSVIEEYLALPDGAGSFTQDFTGPALLRIPLPLRNPSPTGLSPAMAGLPRPFDSVYVSDHVVLQPRSVRKPIGLGWSAFARHYLRNHFCFLLLGLLRCFSSARSPPV